MALFGLVFVLWAVSPAGSYVEVVPDTGCHSTEFRLTCRELEQKIVILDAFFIDSSNCTSAAGGAGTKPPTTTPSYFTVDENETSTTLATDIRQDAIAQKKHIRQPVKHRCSGVNHCSFRLTSDYEVAEDWGPGVVFIKYACINQQHITKTCQQDIAVVGEGFVQTPGYPQFNVESNCTWKLRAQEGQRVQVTLLDISLRGIGSTETECTDTLTVKEGDRQLLSLCGEQEDSIVFESDGAGLDVFISIRSKNIFPKRGVLFQYKALSCPPLKTPEDVYLVDRNSTHAQYRCRVGFVFPDTSRPDRSLYCQNGHTWTKDLPDCINGSNSIWTKNSSLVRLPDSQANLTTALARVVKESDFIYDIMLPTTIICVLLIGNGVVIFVIFYLRKRRKLAQQAEDEELGAIFQANEGSIADKAISV